MTAKWIPIPIPHGPVERVRGRALTNLDGSRWVEYETADGVMYACLSNGFQRQWFKRTKVKT